LTDEEFNKRFAGISKDSVALVIHLDPAATEDDDETLREEILTAMREGRIPEMTVIELVSPEDSVVGLNERDMALMGWIKAPASLTARNLYGRTFDDNPDGESG
jgi:hypothetical protein